MSERTEPFRRNERLEELLQELNELLAPAGAELAGRYRMPRYPVIIIVGLPRSGTTLLLQWLAQTGRFAYPSNLMARFYAAPAIGAMIQEMLTAPAYNFNDEFRDITQRLDFQSYLGKTRGILAPNEFWYFWRRFLPAGEPAGLTPAVLKQVRWETFAADLAAVEAVLDRPFALKGLILQFQLPFLDQLLDRALFLHVRRHPFYNAQSLLEAREQFFGHREAWYSFKPPEYAWLKDRDPLAQVAGQVFFTDQAVTRGLESIAPERQLAVEYEAFCRSPVEGYRRLCEKLAEQGYRMQNDYAGPEAFRPTNQMRLSESDQEGILRAYQEFSGIELKP